jgi:hypothetical protein
MRKGQVVPVTKVSGARGEREVYRITADGMRHLADQQPKLLRVRLRAQGQYEHFFGHDASLKGLRPPGRDLPAHLLLTLDTGDPLLARLKLDSVLHFRLVHPFRYSQGNAFAYRQSEGSIEFIQPSASSEYIDWPEGDIDWPDYDGPYPKRFTKIPASLEVEEPPPGELKTNYGSDGNGKEGNLYSPYTYCYARDSLGAQAIFLGAAQRTIQIHKIDCPVCTKRVRLIARMPDHPKGAKKSLWGGHGVYTLFWYCEGCQIVVTHNEI